jgi:hypothetical protein
MYALLVLTLLRGHFTLYNTTSNQNRKIIKMATTVKTLNGFELKEFALDRLYSPQEQREIKSGNSAYFAEVNRVKRAKEFAEQEAKKPRKLSEDELYQIRLAEDNKRKADQQAREDAQLQREQNHRDYLNSFPDRAAVVATSLFGFLIEQNQWILKGYELETDTIDCLPPSHYVAYLTKPEAPEKTSKK